MHVYKKGTKTKTYVGCFFFLNTFIDHLGKDTVVDIVGITKENQALGLALRKLKCLIHNSRKLPNEREREMLNKFSFCIEKEKQRITYYIFGIEHFLVFWSWLNRNVIK